MTHELKTGGDRGYLRIATEEAFATQQQFDAIMRLIKEGRADQGHADRVPGPALDRAHERAGPVR